jgi:hypothetical protein
MMDRSRLQALKRQIEGAFAGVPRPGAARIGYDPDDWEASQLASAFRGKGWAELTPEELQLHSWSFLSQEGLQYYFPAYLFAALEDHGNILPMTVHGLTLTDEPELRRYRLERFDVFMPAQKRAIRAFLEYVRDELGDVVGDSAREALEAYWRQEGRK